MKLRDIISDIKSGDWGKDSLSDNYTEVVYCIRGTDIPNINNGEKQILPSRFIKEKAAKTKALSCNNLVVEISGGSPTQSTGRIAFISHELLSHYDKRIICSNFCKVIIPKNINPEYLYYYWKDLYNKGILFSYENGTTGIKNLDLNSFINEQDIRVPDPNIQQKIVQILKSLDDKIELNRRINANLEAQAQALFRSWFVDNETNDLKYYELGDVATITAGGDKPAVYSKDLTEQCCIPIYSNGIDNEGLYGYTNSAKINTASITISARGTIGYVCLRTKPYVPIVRLISVVPNKSELSAEFLYLWALTQNISGTGTTQQQLTVPDFRKTSIGLPPEETLKRFNNVTIPIFQKIDINKNENKTLSDLRDTLLPKLMNGEIKINTE